MLFRSGAWIHPYPQHGACRAHTHHASYTCMWEAWAHYLGQDTIEHTRAVSCISPPWEKGWFPLGLLFLACRWLSSSCVPTWPSFCVFVFGFVFLPCVSVSYLPTWHCQGARPLLFANNLIIATTLVLRGENARDSFLASCTLCPSLQRSAPAQPPTEGAEGAAPGGGPPGPPPNMTSNRRLQQTQAQVEEVGG